MRLKEIRHLRELAAFSAATNLATTLLQFDKNYSCHRQVVKAKLATFSQGKIILEGELL